VSEPVVAREVAEIAVQDWEELFSVTMEPDTRETVVRAIMSGRLTLDEGSEEFAYKLRRPIVLENGTKIEEMKLHEPTAGQLRDAAKGKREDFETTLRLIGYITGCAVMDRVGQKDLLTMAAVVGFFG